MRVFIAGATGVLGRALRPILAEQGHTIRTLVRSEEQAQVLRTQGIEVVMGDLLSAETATQLSDMLHGCEAVMHLATAIPRHPSGPQAWQATAQLRTIGTRRLLQAALAAGATRYVQQSIVMAYPDHGNEWIDESMPLDASPQRATVCAPVIVMEDMIKSVSPQQLAWYILRGGSFVGSQTMQDDTIAQLRMNKLSVPCDGRNFLSLIHVADMAAAVAATLQAETAGLTLNIVAEPIRNGDYLDGLADLLHVPHPARDTDQPCPPSFRCSNTTAQRLLHWQPTHSIWPVI